MENLLTSRQAALFLGVSESFLERDRWAGARIPYYKIGKAVRYRPSDLTAFLETRRRHSTSEDSPEADPR